MLLLQVELKPIWFDEQPEDNKQFVETLKSMQPTGRFADPEEIANAVVWLLSSIL